MDKNALLEHMLNKGAVRSSNILEAFKAVDRADFVADAKDPELYEDHPLPIGHGQTISQPSTVAMMLEMLNVQKGDSVLDIGSGSGWTTALLAFLAGEKGLVVGLERLSSLVRFGRKNLKKYGFKNAEILKAGSRLGIENKTFDKILVSAAADELPSALTTQLKPGGKLVMPVRNFILEITKEANGELDIVEHYGFIFVPLVYEN